MSWIDEVGTTPDALPPIRSKSSPQRRRSRSSRPTMWWVGWGLAVSGAIVAWLLVFAGHVPDSPSDTLDIAISLLGISTVLLSVLGYGLYQDAAFQSGLGTHEPAWRPTTIARIALLAAFIAGGVHAFRVADLIARIVST